MHDNQDHRLGLKVPSILKTEFALWLLFSNRCLRKPIKTSFMCSPQALWRNYRGTVVGYPWGLLLLLLQVFLGAAILAGLRLCEILHDSCEILCTFCAISRDCWPTLLQQQGPVEQGCCDSWKLGNPWVSPFFFISVALSFIARPLVVFSTGVHP